MTKREELIEAMARTFIDATDVDDFYIGDDTSDLTSVVIDGSGDVLEPMRAALTALETALGIDLTAIAEGRVACVPVEPTDAMANAIVDAANIFDEWGVDKFVSNPREVYRAMLAARSE